MTDSYADAPLSAVDPEIDSLIQAEIGRQQENIELIASENFVPIAILQAAGSVLTNKYAEGYPGARYYGGCQFIDGVERLAIARAKALFGAAHANVQPHSGSQANAAVYYAALEPGDTVLAMRLDHGGHLTHGLKVNFSGRNYRFCHYGVSEESGCIDHEAVLAAAKACRPKLIVAGASAYPRTIDFTAFRAIADEVGATLMVDMAHIAGLIAAEEHPSPFPHAQWITTTTHKTLAGPRGGAVFCTGEHAAKLDRAIFPGTQGGPLEHIIAAKAVCFHLASLPEFKAKQRRTVENAKVLAEELMGHGLRLVSGGTDNHLMLLDFRDMDITGLEAQELLDQAGITTNKNAVPGDRRPPTVTSGLRVGSPAMTTRGFGPQEMKVVARIIAEVVTTRPGSVRLAELKEQSLAMTAAFPLYRGLVH